MSCLYRCVKRCRNCLAEVTTEEQGAHVDSVDLYGDVAGSERFFQLIAQRKMNECNSTLAWACFVYKGHIIVFICVLSLVKPGIACNGVLQSRHV
jgi:hypothetical protein